jgi:MFS family permease
MGQNYAHEELPERSSFHPHEQLESEDEDEKDDHEHGQQFAPSYTAEEERTVIKKFDRRLVLFMALLYMLSFLDRSSKYDGSRAVQSSANIACIDIGNAKIAGLEQDLHLTSSQYEWLLTAFYITYIVFEWMTLMYRIVPPHIYISICVFSWGLLASLQSLATSFGSLVIIRALLGVSEAAFGPGVPYYLSFFFKRDELAFRTGLFISAAPIATSFASSLAWIIVKLSTNGPLSPWRALFLVEGFPSVAVSVFAWFHVPDSPGKAKYLTLRERKIAKIRLRDEQGIKHHDQRRRRMDWGEIGRTLADPKCYLTAVRLDILYSRLLEI